MAEFRQPKPPRREELARVFKDQRLIRAFEQLFEIVPFDVVELQRLAEEASTDANTGISKAQQALGLIVEIGKLAELASLAPAEIEQKEYEDLTPPTVDWHNSQAGLQGGVFDERFHITESEHTALTGIDSVITVTTNHSALLTEETILVDTSAGDVTVSLPTASGITGKMYKISKITSDANDVIIDPDGAELINNLTTLDIAIQYDSYALKSTGTGWTIQ